YQPFATATQLPEPFRDANGDGVRDVREPWFDINGNGTRDAFEPWVELDGNGVFSATEEDLVDTNGSGTWDKDMPTEAFTDENGNGRWDPAEPYWDMNGDGVWTPPTSPKTPWMAFKPQHFGNTVQEAKYLADYGEPFLDRDGDAVFDSTPEPLVDTNGNGLHDTGYARGEMYFTARYDEAVSATILELHGTPLEAPADAAGAGLGVEARLYDLDYVPCPTPSTITDPDRFSRDLSVVGTFPKNTARWVVEVPTSAIRNVFASAPGAADGDKVDHLLTVETRIGTDLTTGVLWPDRREPTNCSTTYAWFADSLDDVPYSERYQFQGDPRHSPYADTDLIGRSFRNGYNHYFDSFRSSGVDARDQWLAIDGDRVADRWAGRADFDVPRYMDWLRTAFTRSEIFFANVGGLAFEAMSLGGEVAAAGPTLGAGVPMSGVPFGLGAKVDENALFDTGTSSVRGTRKLVREGITTNASRRAGGGWWSKPWLGELAPDSAYATQWKPHGNLVAARAAHAGVFRQVRRSDLPSAQLPRGTQLSDARGELGVLGGTAFFHAGRRGQTFQQGLSGVVGQIVEDGYELGTRYGVALPTAIAVTHPFRLEWGGESKVNGLAVGPAFTDTRTFPRFSTQLMTSYFAEDASATGLLGSAGVRLIAPDNKMARILISSLYENTEDGASFLGRYALLSLVHAHANEGVPGRARRVRQLPSLRITAPLTDALYPDPRQIDVRWNVDWERWDQRPYDTDTPSEFSEKAGELVYRVLYSWNDGGSWHYMQDGSETQPGALARLEDGRPDPKYAVRHRTNPRFQWSTPVTSVPDASYLLRVEAHRSAEPSHYSFKVDRFDVSRPAP
ncbi:MAG: hypothetical protein P1V36_07310, partial [Planctomycetota bacterium]|nr:hypothetical protein [Planctomycetota bacterium]